MENTLLLFTIIILIYNCCLLLSEIYNKVNKHAAKLKSKKCHVLITHMVQATQACGCRDCRNKDDLSWKTNFLHLISVLNGLPNVK